MEGTPRPKSEIRGPKAERRPKSERWVGRRACPPRQAAFSEDSLRRRLRYVGEVWLNTPSMKRRQAEIRRVTKETRITVTLRLNGTGNSSVDTGIPFFDHMLVLFARHAVADLDLRCRGDLAVDAHHTVEDCGIALGQAFAKALGDKKGLRRYGTGFDPRNPFTGEAYVPMDECLARCVIDFSGRPLLIWRGLNDLAYKTVRKAERRQDMSSAFRFGLAREFSRVLPTRPDAPCTWSCCMAMNRTIL